MEDHQVRTILLPKKDSKEVTATVWKIASNPFLKCSMGKLIPSY